MIEGKLTVSGDTGISNPQETLKSGAAFDRKRPCTSALRRILVKAPQDRLFLDYFLANFVALRRLECGENSLEGSENLKASARMETLSCYPVEELSLTIDIVGKQANDKR